MLQFLNLSGNLTDFSLLLADIAVKTSLLLLAILIADRLIRKRSAATLHRLWTLGFLGCLVIPLVGLLVPSWTLPLIQRPDFTSDQVVTTGEKFEPARTHSGTSPSESSVAMNFEAPRIVMHDRGSQFQAHLEDSSRKKSEASTILQRPTTDVADASPVLTTSSQPISESQSGWGWLGVVLVVWLSGVALCLLRMIWQHVLLIRIRRRSTPIEADEWTKLTAELSESLRYRGTVRLCHFDDHGSPACSGILQPVILLPKDCDQWNLERRQVVLLHELAHVKRQDVLTQFIADVVCAVLWFNPLSWFGMLQMRKLRELACDDLVLATGQRPTDYADALLDVARSYRSQNLATVVGMVRPTKVETRILAVLDQARSRVALTRRSAGLLFATIAAGVLLIGSVSPYVKEVSAQTDSENSKTKLIATAQPTSNQQRTANAPESEMRQMEVLVRDEDGKPLAGANLHVGVWYVEGYDGEKVPRNFTTSDDGTVTLDLPKRLNILRLWARVGTYVPEFVNFAQGTHDQGRKIPNRFVFELARGTELSGVVVDESGDPISGVHVDVKLEAQEPAWTVYPKPIYSTWLTDEDFNESTAITDENGHWKIQNAPASEGEKDWQFYLKFTHENYASDTRWGGLQEQQKVTTDLLRNGTTKVVMQRGVEASGTVSDASGQPVKRGLVIWHDNPYLSSAVHETQIDETGQFKTLPLSPGEYPFTIVAPGFQPHRERVNVEKSMSELSIKLKPGKQLTLKIVDNKGNPIPEAYVGLRRWRGVESLYNHIHPNVPDSRIPTRADENGLYVWDWAPEDAVEYMVSAKNYAYKTLTLTAREEEHLVKLTPELVAAGQVTDAKTGAPVREFRVVPVIEFRPKFLSTIIRGTIPGRDGRYTIDLAEHAGDDDRYRFRIRIEAEGYRSAISQQSFGHDEGQVTVDFSLEPAVKRDGRIVDASGKPVRSASLIIASPSILPIVDNNRLNGGGEQLVTRSNGIFQLAPTFEPIRIRVVHETGFAEVLKQPQERIGVIAIQPWASVSGHLLQEGKPVSNERITFYPLLQHRLGDARFQDSYSAVTDAKGHFELAQLPPIPGNLRAYLGPWRDSALTSSQSIPLDLRPGEQRTVTLGGEGVTLTGQIVATGRGDTKLNKNWSLNNLIKRDGGIELPQEFPSISFDPQGTVQPSWFLDPASNDWLRSRDNHFVKPTPDGQIQIGGVSPGTYDLVLRLYEQPAGCLVETVGEKVVTIEVTQADVDAGQKDLGEIEVACRVGPRVGQNMQAYKFTDVTGRQRAVYEMKGNYILMHVWASWCAPCLAHMPELQATSDKLAEEPIVFVGLNLDEDNSRAKSLARKGNWNWAQNYLGSHSDMIRQLGLSSVPTYYLIGPDGNLAAVSSEWSEMQAVIEQKFE